MLAKTLFAFIVGLTPIEPSLAASVTGAEMIDYGVWDKVSIGSRKEPAVLTGQVDEVPTVKLKERITTIPATLGISFGITVKLTESPLGERVNCSIRWIHPKLTNPETKQSSDQAEFPSRCRIGEVEPTGYTFEHPWELVPGTWTVQVVYDSKVLAEKTFNVVLPR